MGISVTKDRLGIMHITLKSKRSLEVENDKLRQVTEAVLQCNGFTGCDACPMNRLAAETLRELGVEVD